MSTGVTGDRQTRTAEAGAPRGTAGAPTFAYRGRALHCEEVPVEALYRAVGPLYVYSAQRLRDNAERVRRAFARVQTLVAYAVKANSNPAVLRLFYERGLGFEVSSGAELSIALATGAAPAHLVVSGSARTDEELAQVAGCGAYLVSVDSEAEE